MLRIFFVLRSVLIVTVLSGIVFGVSGSGKPDLLEQTIEVIKNYMANSHAPWPDEWEKEYIATIRSAIETYRDVPHYTLRLEILIKGFAPYWDGFTKSNERSLFEVHQARIRWYTEHLMNTEFPSEDEIKKLRNQYKDLWDHAADSLLKQFPFLDPNAVQRAKQDDLSECYSKIDAPLMPVYLKGPKGSGFNICNSCLTDSERVLILPLLCHVVCV